MRRFTGDNQPTPTNPWRTLTGANVTEAGGTAEATSIGGQEIRLRDPMWIIPPDEQPNMPILAHGGYYSDPAYDAILLRLAALHPAPAQSDGVNEPRTRPQSTELPNASHGPPKDFGYRPAQAADRR